jgi:hemoglobin
LADVNESPNLEPDHIAGLVERFYDKVRRDPELSPVFNAAVHDWDDHKRTLTSFWSSVALKTASYRGNPMAAHRAHPIRAEHFDRWLNLWRETTAEVLAPEHAAQLCQYAERIGQSLRYGLGFNGAPGARGLGLPMLDRGSRR